MLTVGSYVVKSHYGVCKVVKTVKVDEKIDRLYYLLVPVEREETQLYQPVDREDKRVRSVISKEEAASLLQHMSDIEALAIPSERQREEIYAKTVNYGGPDGLIALIKLIHDRKQARNRSGKDIISLDRKYYQQALTLLAGELSFVTGQPRDDVEHTILAGFDNPVDS